MSGDSGSSDNEILESNNLIDEDFNENQSDFAILK